MALDAQNRRMINDMALCRTDEHLPVNDLGHWWREGAACGRRTHKNCARHMRVDRWRDNLLARTGMHNHLARDRARECRCVHLALRLTAMGVNAVLPAGSARLDDDPLVNRAHDRRRHAIRHGGGRHHHALKGRAIDRWDVLRMNPARRHDNLFGARSENRWHMHHVAMTWANDDRALTGLVDVRCRHLLVAFEGPSVTPVASIGGDRESETDGTGERDPGEGRQANHDAILHMTKRGA
jgi:hypothetical protein